MRALSTGKYGTIFINIQGKVCCISGHQKETTVISYAHTSITLQWNKCPYITSSIWQVILLCYGVFRLLLQAQGTIITVHQKPKLK
jgi:hypothetical protein